MVALWDAEAERHGVFPLDDRGVALFGARFRARSPHPENRCYVYRPPMSPLPAQASAAIGGRHADLTARVTLAAGDEGVLFATGTQNSGISMFVQGARLVLDYNAFSAHTIVESDVELTPGDHELVVRLRRGAGMTGRAEVVVDGRVAGSADLTLFMRMISSIGPSVGSDHGSPVSTRYAAPFEFTGTLHEVVLQASPEKYGDVAEADERAEMSRQ
jgi:arylsulfatase